MIKQRQADGIRIAKKKVLDLEDLIRFFLLTPMK